MTGRWLLRIVVLLTILLLDVQSDRPLLAAQPVELQQLSPEPGDQLDRYRVTLRKGGTLWNVASDYLPLVSLDDSEAKAYQLVVEGFRKAYPDRQLNDVKPDDSFTLEVPPGTFVSREVGREQDAYVYQSFAGDRLIHYPKHPTLVYRLIRHGAPDRAEVKLTGEARSALALAREIYQVDEPDFLHVRMVRGALNDRDARVLVDVNRKYLDDFRNYRARAIGVEEGDLGMTVYSFAADDQNNPYLRVEDAIGDEVDPAAFPRELRLAFQRDGIVRRYLITESGDSVAQLNQPDPERWRKVLPEFKEWEAGTVEPLPPFTPAVNEAGQLIPGRILVLRFAPKVAAPATAATSASPAPASNAGLTCLGVPLAVVLSGLAAVLRNRLPLFG